MKTPEQLKGAIRNVVKKNNLMPQEVLQMFLFERILEQREQEISMIYIACSIVEKMR